MKTFVEEYIEQLARSAGAIDTVTKFLATRGIREKGSGFAASPDGRRWETSVVFAGGMFRLRGEIVMHSHAAEGGETRRYPHVVRSIFRLTTIDDPEGDRLDLSLDDDARFVKPKTKLRNAKKPSPWIIPFVNIEHQLSVGLTSHEKAGAAMLNGIADLLAE